MKRILGVLIAVGLLAVPVFAQEKVTRGGEPTPSVDARPGGFCIIAYGEDYDDDADPQTPDVYRQVWDVQVYQLLNGYSSARYGRDVTITREQILAALTPAERQALRSIAQKAFAYVAAQLGESTTADDDAGKGVGGGR